MGLYSLRNKAESPNEECNKLHSKQLPSVFLYSSLLKLEG